MDLNNITLDEWLREPPIESFYLKKHEDFHYRYGLLKDYLKKNVYDHVVMGAYLKDPDILLNDHGIKHVETVIEKATEIVSCENCDFTAYEVFILLSCILIHDAGIILGRHNHEINIIDIITEAKNLCGEDTVETILIAKIVESHGGKILGTEDKNKIIRLRDTDKCLKGVIRTQAIASVLRLADELADDKRRSSVILLQQKGFPKKSQVYHMYSLCLDNVFISHEFKTIELFYKIKIDYATVLYGSMHKDILLIDEIYNRILKMHLERIYCMRFLKGIIDIDKILVSIEFFAEQLDTNILPELNFEVSESGYPKGNIQDLFSLCKPLINTSGQKIDGEYIKNQIESVNGKKSILTKLKEVIGI